MTVRGTLGLLLVLAVLGLVLLVDRPQAPTPTVLPALLDVPVARVTRLEVRWPEVVLTAERRDGGWRDRGGRVLPSDTVDKIVGLFAKLELLNTAEVGAYFDRWHVTLGAFAVKIGNEVDLVPQLPTTIDAHAERTWPAFQGNARAMGSSLGLSP